MKSKKLISLLCAAALTTSAFAGLTVTTASADGELLTLTDFAAGDILASTATTGFEGKWKPGNGDQLVTVKSDEDGTYLQSTITEGKGSTYDATYKLATPITATSYVLEFDTSIHKSTGMDRSGRMNQIAFTSSSAKQDPRSYPKNSNPNDLETGKVYSSGIVTALNSRYGVDGLIVNDISTSASDPIVTDAINVADDEWVRVQSVVNGNKANITVINASGTKILDNEEYPVDATSLDAIHLIPGRGDKNITGQGVVCLDNVHVYTGDAKTLTTDGLRGEAAIATPVPDPETVSGAAPYLVAPDSVTNSYTADFNGASAGTILSINTTAQDPKAVVSGMTASVGDRKNGADLTSNASIVEPVTGDKVLKLAAGQYGTNGRGPIVKLDDELTIATGETAIMGFSTYLSKANADGVERLYLLDTTDAEHVDGNKVARDVLAVITTENITNEDGSYKYTAGESNIGVHVEPDQWHKIVVAVSEDAYRIFVDEKYKDSENKLSPALKNTLVGTGADHKHAVTKLPRFAVVNAKSDAGSGYAVSLIDNVVAYKITESLEAKYLPTVGEAPTPAPPTPTPVPKHTATIAYDKDTKTATITTAETEAFDAVLINAAYNTDGTLASVKSYPITGISNAAAKTQVLDPGAATGGKLMLWNTLGDMVPFASFSITNGEAQPTSKPAPTSTPGAGTEPTSTPGTGTEPTSTPGTGTEPTSTPGTGTEPTSTPGAGTEPTSTPVATVDPAKVSKLDISRLDAETVMYGKKVSDLGTFTLNANEGKIIGTSNYVNGYTQFSSVVAEQEGHYIPVRVSIPSTVTDPTKAVVTYGTDSKKSVIRTYNKFTTDDRDLDVVYILNDDTKTLKFTVDWDGDGKEYTTENVSIDISDVTKAAKPVSSATIGVLTGVTNIGNKTAEDLSTGLAFATPTTENTVAVTGTLKYVDSYPAMGAVAQTHYYLPYKISGLNENAVVYVQSKDDFNYTDSETGKTYKRVTAKSFDNAAKTELFGVQAVSAEKKSFTIMVDTDGDGTVYDKTTYTIDVSALTLAEPASAVPYAAGTVTYEDTSAKPLFVNQVNTNTISVADGDSAKGNATKVERVTSTVNNYRRANAIVFPNGFQATGTVKITFDYFVNGRMSDIYIVGEDADLGGAKSDAAIVTKNILGLVTNTTDISVNSGSPAGTASLNVMGNWAHVEAVVNTNDKTTSLKIYNYKANNNYANAVPVYTKDALAFKDSTITGVAGLYIAGSNGMDACFDNVCITPDEGYVYPNKVTVTAPATEDGTLAVDKKAAKAGDVITVTATAKAGKKVTAVKANDTPLVKGDDGKYTYRMPDPAVDVTISATYARADVTSIEISGDAQVSVSAGTANYTALAKADTTTVDGTITWSVAAKDGSTKADGTTIDPSTGVLTIDKANQTAGTIVITASTKKDITSVSTEAENTVTATKEVTLVAEPVYNLAVATGLTGGSVALKVNDEAATQVKKSETLTIEPTAGAGYNIDKVYYILTSALEGSDPQWTEVTKTGDAYTVAGSALKGDITVKATFTAISYAITNATASENGNSAAIKIGAEAAATATVGQTVTIVPTVAQGYKVKSVAVTKTDDTDTTVSVTNNTFKMPAYPVTVTVTFETWDGLFYENTFTLENTDTADFLKKANGTNITRKISDGAFVFSTNAANGTRSDYQDLGVNISGASEYKVTYDWTLGTSGTVGTNAGDDGTISWMSFADSAYKIVFGIEVYNGRMYLYKGGNQKAGAGKNDEKIIWKGGVATAETLMSSGATNGLPVKVEATVNYTTGKMNIIIKNAQNSNELGKLENVDIASDVVKGDIRYFAMGSAREGSGKISSNITNAKIDNILITAPWYTAPAVGDGGSEV